jgi:hypothetical protein
MSLKSVVIREMVNYTLSNQSRWGSETRFTPIVLVGRVA